jgi:iron(III) transport system substrate-binding protein
MNQPAKNPWGRFLVSGRAMRVGLLPLLVLLLLLAFRWPGLLASMRQASENTVVLYCAQDQVFAEPILARFTQQTGFRVKPVFDSEAVKTVGLANRLLAERDHPVCDVFWGNEEFRTRQLSAAGVFRATNGWAAFGQRSRQMVVNTNRVGSVTGNPFSLLELTNSAWRGKVSLAFPLFGTTATHFLALRQHWGEAAWKTWCQALAANRPFLEEGNSRVVQRVARGEAWIGLTDSDDITAARREGLPVAAVTLGPESLLIPNTVGLVAREGPVRPAAQALFDYLQSPTVRDQLIAAGALEPETPSAPRLHPEWNQLLSNLNVATDQLKEIFRR